MTQIMIETSRGVSLFDTFTRPVDYRDTTVIFSHTFLSDRYASGMSDSLDHTLRRIGYATFTFDYSGHDASGNEIITFDPLIEDFRSVSSWFVDQGFVHQICVGCEFSAVVALRLRSPAVQTYALISPALGPLSYNWNFVSSDVQFSDLEYHGVTIVSDDSGSVRRQFTVSKCTLADIPMVSGEGVSRGLSALMLITHDSFDKETDLLDRTREVFHLLPNGSLAEVTAAPDGIVGEYTPVDGVSIIDEAVDRALTVSDSAYLPTLADVAIKWASRWVSVGR